MQAYACTQVASIDTNERLCNVHWEQPRFVCMCQQPAWLFWRDSGVQALLLTILVNEVVFSVNIRCSDLISVDLCVKAPQLCVGQQSFWAVIIQLCHPKTEININKAFLQLPETRSSRESWEQLWEQESHALKPKRNLLCSGFGIFKTLDA